jgi:hypothetical protein
MRNARRRVVTLVAALIVVAGCSAGGGSAATSGPAASSQPAASAAQASSAPAASAAAASAAASAQPAAGGTFPADPCKLVTAADVSSIYGGSVKALGLDENGACPFEITGKAKAGQSAAAGEFAVSFGDQWSSYDTAKLLFGSGVTKVDGLGTEAYSVGGFIHSKVGTGDLVVGGVWVGDYDRALLATETAAMAKLLLGRL